MRLCSKEFHVCLEIENSGSCGSCPGKKGGGPGDKGCLSIEDVVPGGLCPFAYFSIIPYWLSFQQGTWFRWRENKDDVVCQCPKSGGPIFLVRKTKQNGENAVYAEIENEGACPLNYKKGQTFRIENENLCPALFPSLFSGMERDAELEVECSLSTVAVNVKCIENRKEGP